MSPARLRFTIRRMMVIVAPMALSLAMITWFVRFMNDFNQSLRDFYGPGRVLDRERDASRRRIGGSGSESTSN
jgi:hypothetical protein